MSGTGACRCGRISRITAVGAVLRAVDGIGVSFAVYFFAFIKGKAARARYRVPGG